METRLDPALAAGNRLTLADYAARHFLWRVDDAVGFVTLDRPERKNPLTFEVLRRVARSLRQAQIRL